MQAALHEVEGTYGIAVICKDEPDTLVVARKGSPLIIGVGQDEYVVASDASAIVEHTTQVIYLNDNEMAVLKPGLFPHHARSTTSKSAPSSAQLENKLEEYELGDYEHYMLKEIFEQPAAMRSCLGGRAEQREGRIVLGGLTDHVRDLVKAQRYILTGQGTAWHAALVGDYLMEDLAKVVTEATYASEFRYRNPIVEEGTVVVAISQSGETADTLAALREGKEKGALAPGRRQRRRLHHRPRNRRRHLSPRRPGNRRRQHQGIYLPVRGADDAVALHRPPAIHEPDADARK